MAFIHPPEMVTWWCLRSQEKLPRFSRFSCLEPFNPWTSGRSHAVPRGVTAACQGSSNSSFHVEKVCLQMVCWVWWVWCWKLKIERMIVHCVWYCRYLMYSVMMHVSSWFILIYKTNLHTMSWRTPGFPLWSRQTKMHGNLLANLLQGEEWKTKPGWLINILHYPLY